MTSVTTMVLVSLVMLALGYVLGRRRTIQEAENHNRALAQMSVVLKSHLTGNNDEAEAENHA